MSDFGRYGDDTSYRDRDRSRDEGRRSGGGFSRNSGSIFGSGSQIRSRDDDWQRSQGRHDDHRRGGGSMGGGGYMRSDRDERSSGRYEERGGGRDKHFGPDDDRQGLPVDETSRLIASNKVEGTAVYGSDGHRLGSIYNFMVNKFSGKVEYAVMAYGGFLGMGQRYYPIPWQILTYDTREGGYHIAMTERDLRDAPSFDRDTEPKFDNQYGDRVNSWYGVAM